MKTKELTQAKVEETVKVKNKFKILPYLKQHKIAIIFYFIFQIIPLFTNVYLTVAMASAIQSVATGLYTIAIRQFLIIGAVTVCKSILDWIYELLFNKVYISILADMSADIAEQTFKISSKSYSNHNTGSFTERIIQDPRTIFDLINAIIENIGQLLSSIVIIGYVTVISPIIGLIFIFGVIISTVLTRVRLKTVRRNRSKRNKKNEEILSLLTEVVKSERDIKSLNLEQPLSFSMKKKYKEYKKIYKQTENSESSMHYLSRILVKIIGFACLILGIVFLNKGSLTLGVYMIIYSDWNDIEWLAYCISNLMSYGSNIKLSYNRINELYENDEYELERFGKHHLKHVKGKIEFKDVGFSYVEYKFANAENDNDENKSDNIKKKHNKKSKANEKPKKEITSVNKVFNKLSFTIEPNTTVAFVGKSGSGKSTILNLMSKINEVDDGKVLIDGVNINSLDKSTLRQSIALVNQFPYIFDMTIRANLELAKPGATEEEIQAALKQAALDDFINSLPNGINSRVGEGGIKLSGGQKQRLAIARALLKKCSIILFDESTSSLDNIAQNTVKESIDKIKGKSTIVIVAHRLSTIKNVDKIFFLENGEICDEGTFNELFKRNKNFKNIFMAENI